MPKEVEGLLKIAKIKNLARDTGIIKISEKRDGVVFLYANGKFDFEKVNGLVKKYGSKIKFSQGVEPYVTLGIKKASDKEFLNEIEEYLRSWKVFKNN